MELKVSRRQLLLGLVREADVNTSNYEIRLREEALSTAELKLETKDQESQSFWEEVIITLRVKHKQKSNHSTFTLWSDTKTCEKNLSALEELNGFIMA